MTPQELKNSILQLAIQGRLVEQRPEEGTAEELYKKIQAEKQSLIKAGKIKKEKPFSLNVQYRDYPFEIPDSWIFVRFGDLMINRDSERIPVSTSDRTHKAKIYDYYGASGVIDKIDDYLFDKELLLIGEDGANLLARSTPIAFLAQGKYWVNNHAHVLDACGGLYLNYICYYINAISLAPYVTGTAQPKMNQENMNAIWVALPPLAEQKRIVAKIEELLPLIDRYEKAWTRLEDFNKRFPDDMQKSILQMAIQGKLVEQRPEEGTAEDLYKQIQSEKQSLIKAGKIKKEKPLPSITDDEIPFEIPENWKWVRIGDHLIIERGGSPRPIQEYLTTNPNGINWIKIGDTEKGGKYINQTREKIIPEGLKKSRMVHKGDFLLSNSMSFGRPYILNIDGAIHDGWLVLRPIINFFDKDYLYYLLSSPMVFSQFSNRVAGAVVNNLNSDKVALTVVPLPPLAEQKRIVAKIEELLPLCERLK